MSLEHFRDYCKSFRFSTQESIKNCEEVQKGRGVFYNSNRIFYYVKNKKQMQKLAEQKNIYAIKDDK